MKKLLFLIFLIPMLLLGQDNPLDIFKPLENHTWQAEGKWGDGSTFKQEISVEFSLDGKIVNVQSMGYTDKDKTEFGLRNEGIRHYDPSSKTIKFWEFDVFGGLTEGTVKAEGKDLIYSYEYGGTHLTEMWIYKDEQTYTYVVGVYDAGAWKQKFLETEFRRKAL